MVSTCSQEHIAFWSTKELNECAILFIISEQKISCINHCIIWHRISEVVYQAVMFVVKVVSHSFRVYLHHQGWCTENCPKSVNAELVRQLHKVLSLHHYYCLWYVKAVTQFLLFCQAFETLFLLDCRWHVYCRLLDICCVRLSVVRLKVEKKTDWQHMNS